MYHALIVEDEKEEAQRLSELIFRYAQARNEVMRVTHLASAMEMLADKAHYDLILLDIDLPGINGMEAAELLRVYDQVTPIIFVTNLAKYAVKGYEVNAVGFIVKPATYGNLSMCLDRALRSISLSSKRSVMVPTEDGKRVIPIEDIVFVEVSGHTLTFHLEDGSLLEPRGSLGQLEEDLEGAPIVRVAKNCIVNIDKVMLVRSDSLQMDNGETVQISRTRKREAIDTITDYLGSRR